LAFVDISKSGFVVYHQSEIGAPLVDGDLTVVVQIRVYSVPDQAFLLHYLHDESTGPSIILDTRL
jgi:hypothetical protein